eukprot:scaffold27046_cov28-Phaeocystis_antarctica.AAC.3
MHETSASCMPPAAARTCGGISASNLSLSGRRRSALALSHSRRLTRSATTPPALPETQGRGPYTQRVWKLRGLSKIPQVRCRATQARQEHVPRGPVFALLEGRKAIPELVLRLRPGVGLQAHYTALLQLPSDLFADPRLGWRESQACQLDRPPAEIEGVTRRLPPRKQHAAFSDK